MNLFDFLNDNDYHLNKLRKLLIGGLKMRRKTELEYTLPAQVECRVVYNKSRDAVELMIGGTSLRLKAASFIVINEVIRKAAAKIVMQTEINPVN